MNRIAALSLSLFFASSGAVHAAEGEVVVLRAARLFDGKRTITPGAIVVRDGRIERVGTKVEAPAGAVVHDLGDATLLPGLIDAHVHLGSEASEDWNRDIVDGLRRSVADNTLRASLFAKRTLQAGFTTVRNVGAHDLIDVALERGVQRGWVEGPTIIASGRALGARGGHCDETGFPPGRFGHETGIAEGVASGPDQFRDAVRYQIKYGAGVIKVCATGGVLSLGDDVDTPQLTLAELEAIVEEAHNLDRKVAAHAHGDSGAKLAVKAGVDSIEHGTFLQQGTLTLMKQRGTYLVPTLSAFEGVDPDRRTFPPEIAKKARAAIAAREKSMRLAIAVGVPIALGTDAGVVKHGDNARELELMVRAGMSPERALAAGTAHAAELLGVADRVGTLSTGMVADVIAVRGNATADVSAVRNVLLVMKAGRVVRGPEKQ